MNDYSYQTIKDLITSKLLSLDGVLPYGKIEEEIESTKDFLSKYGYVALSQLLSKDLNDELNESDWKRMQRELEAHFDVHMENGIIIQGNVRPGRDVTWWTGKEKQKNKNYYWKRYEELLKKTLPSDVVKAIGKDTDVIMNNLDNPAIDEFSTIGMVVGHVQSGKTANYSGLICKAADSGYKFIVVIAGGLNNLRDQTQERLNEAFIGVYNGVPIGVGKIGDELKEYLPISLTTKDRDFNKQDANKVAQTFNFDNIKSPIVMVIKKHPNTLTNVIDWLKTQYRNQIPGHAMLLIDDESDYASINTRKEDDPTTINNKIRELLSLFRKSSYVAYTATPYANIFIDHKAENDKVGQDLFPRDFIYALDAPSNYFGARKIFIEKRDKHLVFIDDYKEHIPIAHKITHELTSLPESMYDAVRLFIINVAIRNLRGQQNKHNSMLIHATRFTNIHQKISNLIEEYVEEVKEHVTTYGKLSNSYISSSHILELKNTFETHIIDFEFTWEEVVNSIVDIIGSVLVREVHRESGIPLVYRKDSVTNAIVIGGTSLSRGFTLEGLSVSYFLRSSIFYDTLMQMGRWFGYRQGYEDLCKIYMPSSIAENYAITIEATIDLVDSLKRMAEAKMTPFDFGLAVKYHPDSVLQVTARNKQKNSKNLYFEMKLDGHLKETTKLVKNEVKENNNIKAIEELVHNLVNENNSFQLIQSNYLWSSIEKNHVKKFLNDFEFYKTNTYGIESRMPIDFIKKYVDDVDSVWDVVLLSGKGKEIYILDDVIKINREKRKITEKDKYYEVNQLSASAHEAITLTEELRKKYKDDRKGARENMKNPLLMIHVLEDHENDSKGFSAIGISFPGGISSENKTIKITANTVFWEQLIEEEDSND